MKMHAQTKLIIARRVAGESYSSIAKGLGIRIQTARVACLRAMWKGLVTPEQIRYALTQTAPSDEEYNKRWLARLAARSYPGKNGCIEFKGFHNEDGYGQLGHRSLGLFAHRVATILRGRPIPEGYMACHRCGNHGCVNDDHIYVGTMKENARDTVMMGRHRESQKTRCAQGHEFTPENTYYYRRKRKCRTCQKEWHKAPGYIAWRREYQKKRRALKRAQRQTEVHA